MSGFSHFVSFANLLPSPINESSQLIFVEHSEAVRPNEYNYWFRLIGNDIFGCVSIWFQ